MSERVIHPPGQGRVAEFWGSQMRFLATGAETGGAYAILEYTAPQGAGAGTHRHQHEDEAFYILDGEMTFQIDQQITRLEAGGFIAIPRGCWHAFANQGTRPVRALVTLSPAGLERYFADLGEMAAAHPGGPPTPDAVLELLARYGVEVKRSGGAA